MSTFISGVANPNTTRRPPKTNPQEMRRLKEEAIRSGKLKPKITKEDLQAMLQQRRDDIKINIPAFLENNPSTNLFPNLGEKVDILAEVLGNKPPMRAPQKGTKNTAEASIEK
tara:strand:- start:3279 stop:3617 length:339 start_codon:yes stop_codon:yes gene_type:complete